MCLLPISVRDKKRGGTLVAPCGKCPQCRGRRAQGWQFRLMQEDKRHENSIFLTLTYENPPISEKGFMTLDKTDFQKFIKRLRKHTGRKTIKYYACGEYGSNTMRPHFHAIIFDTIYEECDAVWRLGNIHVGDTTEASIMYTTKYMCKPKKIPLHANDDREPEFSLMSKNMGKNYLTTEMIEYHESNQASYITLPGGARAPLPRYYRDRIFTEAERENFNAQAATAHEENYNKMVKEAGGADNYHRNHHYSVVQAMKKYQTDYAVKRNKI